MKILVVDDNAAVRTSLKVVLSDVFDDIITIGDPHLIPALLKAGDVDAVLLDMNFNASQLDGKEGLLWLTKIKESEMAPAAVLITAFGDVPLAVEAMKIGAEDFVTKPWDNDELIDKLMNAIKINRAAKKKNMVLSQATVLAEKENHRRTLKLDELKYEHACEVVRICGGNLSDASRRLGINRQTLYNILKSR